MDRLIPLEIPPGIYRNGTDYESQGRWFDANLIRFIDKTVKPIGGWQRAKDDLGAVIAALSGVPRGMHSWRGPTGDAYIAVGTTSKLYALSGGSLHDITPAGFAAGSADTAYGSGSSGAFGKGNFGIGAFGYGQLTNTLLEADTWQLDNYGDYLVGVDTKNQKLYVWQGAGGTPAAPIDFSSATGAPTTAIGVVATPERFLVLLGVGGNVRRITWPAQSSYTGTSGFPVAGIGTLAAAAGVGTFNTSQAGIVHNGDVMTVAGVNYTVSAFNGTTSCTLSGAPTFGASAFTQLVSVWFPNSLNTAGSWDLKSQGRIMCAKQTVNETLIWTDVDVHAMVYIGGPLVYRFKQIADKCGAISRRAVVTIGTRALWMSRKSFYSYNGFVQEVPSEVRDYVFSNMNVAQVAKIWATSRTEYSEATWYYCSSGSNDIDSYVTYNYLEDHWTIGRLARTAGVDSGATQNPVLVTIDGLMYEHEVGFYHDGVLGYAESGPSELAGGNTTFSVQKIVPDEKTQGDVNATFYTRNFPNGPETIQGPFNFAGSPPFGCRFHARQTRVRLQEVNAVDWRVGTMRFGIVPSSRR